MQNKRRHTAALLVGLCCAPACGSPQTPDPAREHAQPVSQTPAATPADTPAAEAAVEAGPQLCFPREHLAKLTADSLNHPPGFDERLVEICTSTDCAGSVMVECLGVLELVNASVPTAQGAPEEMMRQLVEGFAAAAISSHLVVWREAAQANMSMSGLLAANQEVLAAFYKEDAQVYAAAIQAAVQAEANPERRAALEELYAITESILGMAFEPKGALSGYSDSQEHNMESFKAQHKRLQLVTDKQ